MEENKNNEKKRFGRRAGFGVAALILIEISFFFCMFKFSDPQIGLKWFLFNAGIVGAICGIIAGVLTITDIKEFVSKGINKSIGG